MSIVPVTPVDKEKLVDVNTSIVVDMSLMPAQVNINGLLIFDGSAFLSSWIGSVVNLLGGGKRFTAMPPASFPVGETVQVYVKDSSGYSITYLFQVGSERITGSDDTSSPTTAVADSYNYVGYIKDPGVMNIRVVNPLSAEIPLIAANIVDIGYDPQINKLIVFFISNGQVYVTTANPGSTGNSILPPGEASTPSKVVSFPFDSQKTGMLGSGGIRKRIYKEDFPALKQAIGPDPVIAGAISSGGLRGARYGFPRSTSAEIVSFNPTVIRVARPTDLSESNLIAGFYLYKGSNNYTGGTFFPFIEFPSSASYVDVTDDATTPDAIYSVVCVYRLGQSTGLVRSPLGAPSTRRPTAADIRKVNPGSSGIKKSYTSTTLPPLKQATPIDPRVATMLGGGGIKSSFTR